MKSVVFGSIALLFVMTLGVGAQTRAPNPALADTLFHEASRLFQQYGTGKRDDAFRFAYNRQAARFNIPPLKDSIPRGKWVDPNLSLVDSLLGSNRKIDVRGLVAYDHAHRDVRGLTYSIIDALYSRDAITEALHFGNAVGALNAAVGNRLYMQDSATAIRLEKVKLDWMRKASIRSFQRDSLLAEILRARSFRDHDGALRDAEKASSPFLRSMAVRLIVGARIPVQDPDNALKNGIEAAFSIANDTLRNAELGQYAMMCAYAHAIACDGVRFPLNTWTWSAQYAAFLNAMNKPDTASADSILRELEARKAPAARTYVQVAKGLTLQCDTGRGCPAAVRPIRDRWIDRLEQFAQSGDDANVDTLRAKLAEIWARDDAKRANGWLQQVRDTSLLSHSGWWAAGHAYNLDLLGSAELVRTTARRGGHVSSLPYDLYTRLLALHEDSLAVQILSVLNSTSERMRNRMGWADIQYRGGNVQAAHDIAFAALNEWNPDIDPVNGTGTFRVFNELHAYDELVTWVRSLPDGVAKAKAMAGIAMELGGFY